MITSNNIKFVGAGLLLTTLLWLINSLNYGNQLFALHSTQAHDRGDVASYRHSQPPTVWELKAHGLKNLGEAVEISTLYVQAVESLIEPDLIQEMDVPLPHFSSWEVDSTSDPASFASSIVNIAEIPRQIDASSIIFGVATNLERLADSLDAFAHWAGDTGAIIVANLEVVQQSLDQEKLVKSLTIEEVLTRAASLSIKLVIRESPQPFIDRYISLIQVLHEEATLQSTTSNQTITWAGIIDDDTFFLSTNRLLTMLSKFDPVKPHYIGSLSEDLNGVTSWGIIAYGGAGVFLSMPLLTQLQPHLPDCLTPPAISGDQRIAECIYKHTSTKLSIDPRMHQLDMMGDHTGFYEAVRPLPLTVHHWKSWAHYDMVLVTAVSAITGEDSILQKYRLANGWWMTHGFSIVKYSDEEDEDEHEDASRVDSRTWLSHREGAMEHTFNNGDTDQVDYDRFLMHSLGPFRPPDKAKQQYLIESAVKENDNTITLYYVHRQDGVATNVIRVIWTRAWN